MNFILLFCLCLCQCLYQAHSFCISCDPISFFFNCFLPFRAFSFYWYLPLSLPLSSLSLSLSLSLALSESLCLYSFSPSVSFYLSLYCVSLCIVRFFCNSCVSSLHQNRKCYPRSSLTVCRYFFYFFLSSVLLIHCLCNASTDLIVFQSL